MDARQQRVLAELTQSVLADNDVPCLMRQVAVWVAHSLIAVRSAIWELLPNGSTLALREGVGWQQAAVGQTAAVMETASFRTAPERSTHPFIVADWTSETRFDQPKLLRDHGVVSSLYVTIHGPSRPFGVLSVDSATHRTFCDAEIFFVQAVANVLALAIERRATNEHVRLVTAARAKAVQEERQRLARDLHDSVTQGLYGITLHAAAATRLLAAGDGAPAIEYLGVLQATAQEALDEMRLLIFDLRPPVLAHVGLVAALQARLNAVEGRAHLETKLVVDGVGDLPALVEDALYRIAQEALNNAIKHAHARHITVQLRQGQSRLILQIIDDGVGFDPAAVRGTGGFGLCGIAERVGQLNGTFTLHSAPGSGTQLCVEIGL